MSYASVLSRFMSGSLQSYGLQPTRLLCPLGFSRQEYQSRLPCPPPGDLPHPGIEPASLTSPALAGGFFTTSATWEAQYLLQMLGFKQFSQSSLHFLSQRWRMQLGKKKKKETYTSLNTNANTHTNSSGVMSCGMFSQNLH